MSASEIIIRREKKQLNERGREIGEMDWSTISPESIAPDK